MRCFNSTLVRLKAYSRQKPAGAALVGFNSTLVRLKDAELPTATKEIEKFQFHTGSIKSKLTLSFQTSSTKFQFHTGSIKSNNLTEEITMALVFQFHTGSIKRRVARRARESRKGVSIPHWFD